jgi:hypothetical protein
MNIKTRLIAGFLLSVALLTVDTRYKSLTINTIK